MNTLSRLFYGGALGALGLTMALHCNADPNNNNNVDQRGSNSDGGSSGDGGGGDGGTNPDGFNPSAVNLTMATPIVGTNLGGTALTLSGTNFPSDAQVFIDGKSAAIQGNVSATQILVTTPAAPAGRKGKVTIEIRRASGTVVASNSTLFSYFLGTPGFGVPKGFDTGTNPIAVYLVEMNNNSRVDAVVANFVGNSVTVLFGQGGGNFVASTPYATGSRPTALAVADYDNDGDMDVATINSQSESVSVLLNDGSGALGAPKNRPLAVNSAPQGLAAGKLDGDVYPDVITANSGSSDMSLLLGAAGGMLGTPSTLQSDSINPAGPNAVAFTDINRDGKLDLLVVNKTTARIGVQVGAGNGTFTSKGLFNTGLMGPFEMAVGDYNGDGIPDVATTLEGVSAPKISVLLGQADGTLGNYLQYAAGEFNGDAPRGIASGDLNGDGLADLVVALNATSNIAILLAQPGGSFATPIIRPVGPAPRGVAIGDIDGDDRPDIVVTTYSNSQLVSLLNNFQ